jgi:hypothetical protein
VGERQSQTCGLEQREEADKVHAQVARLAPGVPSLERGAQRARDGRMRLLQAVDRILAELIQNGSFLAGF